MAGPEPIPSDLPAWCAQPRSRRSGPPMRARRPRSAAQAARIRLTLRRLRLASGLVLFGYVLTHLLNHALGNVSLDAMEDGLDLVTAVWLNPSA